MRLLLDSHILLWLSLIPDRIATEARTIIADPDTELYSSAATFWELSIKQKSGKLDAKVGFDDLLRRTVEEGDIAVLDVSARHGILAGQLPMIHGDPFDRILVAQAILEDCTLVTRDQNIMRYAVPVMRA